MLVHQGSIEQGEKLLASLWPEAPAISDPDRVLYRAFGVGKGSLREVLGPATWTAGLRALRKGHFVGRPVGNPRVQPGLFLVDSGRILWRHDFAHSGDQPDAARIVEAVRPVLAART